MSSNLAGKKDMRAKNSRSQTHLTICDHPACGVVAHNVVTGHDRLILQSEQFVGMTCFDIAHSKGCQGLWSTLERKGSEIMNKPVYSKNEDGDLETVDGEKVVLKEYETKRATYSVNTAHQLYVNLAHEYGIEPNKWKKKRKAEDPTPDVEEKAEDLTPDVEESEGSDAAYV